MAEGYIKLHRCIIDSDIYQMSPLYLRVFERLILEANHKDKTIPYKERGVATSTTKLIKRGERLTSLRQIAEWVSWYERGQLKTPNVKTIKSILEWLSNQKMIFIYNEGNRKETHYKVLNYEAYQSKDTDESNSQETLGKHSLDINKNVKNDKNEKNIDNIYTPADEIENSLFPSEEQIEPPTNKIPFDEIISYLNQKAGTKYKPTLKATQEHIRARYRDGYKLPDFFMVIDKKCTEWIGTEQEKYLRPETLFGTKFEGYLNQKGVNNNGQLHVNGGQVLYREEEREDANAWLPTKPTRDV